MQTPERALGEAGLLPVLALCLPDCSRSGHGLQIQKMDLRDIQHQCSELDLCLTAPGTMGHISRVTQHSHGPRHHSGGGSEAQGSLRYTDPVFIYNCDILFIMGIFALILTF